MGALAPFFIAGRDATDGVSAFYFPRGQMPAAGSVSGVRRRRLRR